MNCYSEYLNLHTKFDQKCTIIKIENSCQWKKSSLQNKMMPPKSSFQMMIRIR